MKEGIQFTHICKILLGGINTQQETSRCLCTCLGQKHHNTGITPGLLNTSCIWPGYRYSSLNCCLDLPGEYPSPTMCSWSQGNEESSAHPRIWWDQDLWESLTEQHLRFWAEQAQSASSNGSLMTTEPNCSPVWSSGEMKSFSLVIIHPISSTLLVSDSYKCLGRARIPIPHGQDMLRSALCPPKLQQPSASVPGPVGRADEALQLTRVSHRVERNIPSVGFVLEARFLSLSQISGNTSVSHCLASHPPPRCLKYPNLLS